MTERLEQGGVRSPIRTRIDGKTFGGRAFTRGQIYGFLKCPAYVGEVHHRGSVYPALHTGIIERDVWDRTRQMLADNLQGHRRGARAASPSPLAGKVFDGMGHALIATHACKGKTRYRYYTSRDLSEATGAAGMRIPALELEGAVQAELRTLFSDGLMLAATARLQVHPSALRDLIERSAEVAGRGKAILAFAQRVCIHDSRIDIDCSTAAIAAALGVERDDNALDVMTLHSDIRLTRSGLAMRLVQNNGALAAPVPNMALVKATVRAHHWWGELKAGTMDVTALAKRHDVGAPYVARLLRLAFLAPPVTNAILCGTTRSQVDVAKLTATDAISPRWEAQQVMLPPALPGGR